jgi:hypothetical protein
MTREEMKKISYSFDTMSEMCTVQARLVGRHFDEDEQMTVAIFAEGGDFSFCARASSLDELRSFAQGLMEMVDYAKAHNEKEGW